MADVFGKERSALHRLAAQSTSRPYYRPLSSRGAEVGIDGRTVVMAGCNDYLGLSADPRVTEAAARALRRYGVSCSGSRVLNGTLALHEELEGRLAAFVGGEAALVTTTGFQANLALAALLDERDAVFADMSNHASLVDAVRLGGAAHHRYRHRDLGHLGRLLATSDPGRGRLIVTDGMFSMEGDLCPLPGLTQLARRHGARLVVDGAHDIGLLGAGGRGVTEHFGLTGEVDLVTGTLSKCFGSVGGMLIGPAPVVEHLRHSARSVLFSAAMPPPSAAAALASLDIIESEPGRRQRVFGHARRLLAGLRSLGWDTGDSTTPVVPVYVGDSRLCLRVWQELLDAGVFTNAVVAPAVARNRALIRVTPQAIHTDDHIARVLDAFARVRRDLGPLLPAPGRTEAVVA
ncbi:aminotransferase class I/II-fold pyridoxal phosphate-dependent enzyme [Streptomyces verrucosisporus]|uniref:aminotransferase class I/II-fold pyridoxal phosphate-dependent enzyme n=1 Tax=Streptomyces verrucosisporus TaxID=1695161 RepID=UPI0019CF4E2F|nr:aminotransferase class I/II-fold pyridoxal phosphate-dependent enzyme [Streptomyces verrucosisporus]MBN3931690.1 aminotransferase class I/II-fold pyridoxal phosphate-dependent enzyme [Streptomyces verrucosisporus]